MGRPIGVAANVLLVLVGLVALAVAIVLFTYLAGEPSAEEAGKCVGGHTAHAIGLLATAALLVLSAAATVARVARGKPAWPLVVLSLGLLAAWIALAIATPELSATDTGQC